MRPQDLPDIRERLQSPEHTDVYSRVVDAADRTLSCVLPVLQPGNGSNHSDSCLSYIESNAFLYLMSEDRERAQKAISGIRSYLKTFEADFETDKLTREAGIAIFTAAEVYDWCYDVLTREDKLDIIRLCVSHASSMECGWPIASTAPHISGHEMEAMIMKDLFGFSVAVYDEFPDAYNAVAKQIFHSYVPTLNYFYESSFHNQGECYGAYRHTFELYLKWILEKIDCGDLLKSDQRYITYQFLSLRRPDGSFMSDGDDYNQSAESYYKISPITLLAGNLYRDPYLRQEFYRCSTNGYTENAALSLYTCSEAQFLLLDDPSIGLAAHEELPLSRWFGVHSGVMAARTGWEEGKNSNVMMVTMKTPERFFKGHGHLDAGEFEIYYKAPLALDSGSYASFGTPHDYAYNKLTVAHNCMLIDGPEETSLWSADYSNAGGQKPPTAISEKNTLEDIKGWATEFGKVLGYDYGEDMHAPSYTYLKGDLTKAYHGKAQKYTRTFLFENFFDAVYPGALIVFDKIESNAVQKDYKRTWLLHAQEEPVIDGNTATIRRTENGYNGRLINQTLLPEQPALTKIGGAGQEYMADGVNYPSSLTEESGRWRVELSYQTPQETEYFLNVLQVSENSDSIVPLPCTKYETASHIGVQIKDRVAYLSKQEQRISDSIRIQGSGENETLLFQVDGLQEGTWNITGNGVTLQKSVSDNGGVLAFEGAPGEYQLSYDSVVFEPKDFSLSCGIDPLTEEKIYTWRNGVFEDLTVEKTDTTVYAPLSEIAALCGGTAAETEQGTRLSKGNAYLLFQEGNHDVIRNMGAGEQTLFSAHPPYRKNGILYASVPDCGKVLTTDVKYRSYMNMLALRTGVTGAEDSLREYLKVRVESSEGGTVTGNSTKVGPGQSVTFTLSPAEGYFIERAEWNGTPIFTNEEEVSFQTPPIMDSNSVLKVIFQKKTDNKQLVLYGEAFRETERAAFITFGKTVNILNSELLEKGVLCSRENPLPTLSDADGKTVLKLPYFELPGKLTGSYGIRVIDSENILKNSCYVRNYAIYQTPDGPKAIYSENSILIQK